MSAPAVITGDSVVVEKIRHLSKVFQERAEDTDRGGPLNLLLRDNIQQLASIGFYGSGIPSEFGGLELSSEASKTCTQLLAGACGVTAFTQQQLHAGGNFIGRCDNEELRQRLLPSFASGEHLCGVGFSHLRRPGAPLVTAAPTDSGYIINGKLPWITAWSILDSFILGATVTDGSIFFAFLPVEEFREHLIPGKPMGLSVMDASETIELQITNLRLPQKYVIWHHPSDHMMTSDYRGIAGHIDMPLGCARGSADYLRALAQRRNRPDLYDYADKIDRQADSIDQEAQNWNGSRWEEPHYFKRAMAARTGAISLAMRAAAAGVAVTSGSAHLTTNPAQRRFRESAFYATQAQTLDIQNSLLEVFIDD